MVPAEPRTLYWTAVLQALTDGHITNGDAFATWLNDFSGSVLGIPQEKDSEKDDDMDSQEELEVPKPGPKQAATGDLLEEPSGRLGRNDAEDEPDNPAKDVQMTADADAKWPKFLQRWPLRFAPGLGDEDVSKLGNVI